MLLLQPLIMLTYTITSLPWTFTPAFRVEYVTVAPGLTIRILIFKTYGSPKDKGKLRPLHVDMHGGAFMGGWAEEDAKWCDQLARETGAVVLSITYRFAPAYQFPTAIDDIDAALRFIQENAEKRYGADATLLTLSGFSAGGNLALAACQAENCREPSPTSVKASVTFYASIDLRTKPEEKSYPADVVPPSEPFAVLSPLYDSYPASVRAENLNNPRMSPILSSVDRLPRDMMLVIAHIDILTNDQLKFVERVKADFERDPKNIGRRIEVIYDRNGFHAYLNRRLSL
jgi:acetyl esterase/lipase